MKYVLTGKKLHYLKKYQDLMLIYIIYKYYTHCIAFIL